MGVRERLRYCHECAVKKDIFIDNNIACRFSNPMDPEMKKLIAWIMEYEAESQNNAILMMSDKLLREYGASCQGAYDATSIPTIIGKLTRERRLTKITNADIKGFQNIYFTKIVERNLRSNQEDRNHIPVVLLSERKFALTNDRNFTFDLEHFPGFRILVSSSPENLPYDK